MRLRSLVPFRERDSLMRSETSPFFSLHREIDRLFDDFTRGFGGERGFGMAPSIDVAETDKEIEITAELPGLERKDVEISLDDDMLTIRGEKRSERKDDQKEGSRNVHVSERNYGAFYRVLQLPARIDPSTVEATMNKGVLKITLPKPAQSKGRKIEVKDAT
jgi:HSP20 family protein